jgi:hypothetical protein
MLKHWRQLLNTDCTVVKVGAYTVYPILRVGSTSLNLASDEKYINQEIAKCDHIDVLLRDPRERFVSGLNEYCKQHNLDVNDTWQEVAGGHLIDRHFAPQFVHLLHLYKFYKGIVTLRPFQFIEKITSVHERGYNFKKTKVDPITSFVEIDYRLLESCNRPIQLGNLIEEHIHALS